MAPEQAWKGCCQSGDSLATFQVNKDWLVLFSIPLHKGTRKKDILPRRQCSSGTTQLMSPAMMSKFDTRIGSLWIYQNLERVWAMLGFCVSSRFSKAFWSRLMARSWDSSRSSLIKRENCCRLELSTARLLFTAKDHQELNLTVSNEAVSDVNTPLDGCTYPDEKCLILFKQFFLNNQRTQQANIQDQ